MLDSEPVSSQQVRLAPVSEKERISSVDILRGFALCGILVINITSYALPAAALFAPTVAGGMSGLDGITWQVSFIGFFQKMMAIFSMLFGAGLILMMQRAEAIQQKFAGVYYRRLFWLAIIGTIHGYFIWYGDILFPYAVCGLVLYPLRRLRAGWLIALGILILLIGAGLMYSSGIMFEFMRSSYNKSQTLEEGQVLSPMETGMVQSWEQVNAEFMPSPEKIAEENAARRGSYWEMTKYFAAMYLQMQIQTMLFYYFWRALSLMLLGMAFMKMGIFSGVRSLKFYTWLMIIGYGLGLPVTIYTAALLQQHNFDFVYYFQIQPLTDYFSSVLIAMAHVGLLMIIIKMSLLKWLTSRLAAVGRMAFTNYLMHSVLMGLVFFGIGLGLFNRIDRFGLIWFVVGTWVLQLIISPLWLKYFRFGPAEWLWRSLTYFKRQPMRVPGEV